MSVTGHRNDKYFVSVNVHLIAFAHVCNFITTVVYVFLNKVAKARFIIDFYYICVYVNCFFLVHISVYN